MAAPENQTAQTHPRDAEPMTRSEVNGLYNRVIMNFEGHPDRMLEGEGDDLHEVEHPPYEPNLTDTARLLRTVSNAWRDVRTDERSWHEEMFRRHDAGFFHNEGFMLRAHMVENGAEWLAGIVRRNLASLLRGGGLADDDRGQVERALEAFDGGMEKPQEMTFVQRLKGVIADEEIRQGGSTGDEISSRFRAENDDGRMAAVTSYLAKRERARDKVAKEKGA